MDQRITQILAQNPAWDGVEIVVTPLLGGIGKVIADWIVEGDPGLDMWHMDIRRFGSYVKTISISLITNKNRFTQTYNKSLLPCYK